MAQHKVIVVRVGIPPKKAKIIIRIAKTKLAITNTQKPHFICFNNANKPTILARYVSKTTTTPLW